MVVVDELVIRVRADPSGVASGMAQASAATTSFTNQLSKSAAGFATVGFAVDRAMNMLDRFEISQITVENAIIRVTNAQENLRQATEKYGEGSEQAADASRQLEVAQNNLDRTNIRANSSMVMIGLSALSMVPQFITMGTTAVKWLKEIEIATLITTTRIKAMAPELLIISLVAGGAYFMFSESARAAEKAQKSFAESTRAGLRGTNEEAEKLKQTLEELAGFGKTTEEKRAVRKAEFEGELEVAGTDPEKRAEAERKYQKDLLRIRKEEAEKAYGAGSPTALVDIKSTEKSIQEMERLERERGLSMQERKDRGLGPTSKERVPIETGIAPSYLEEVGLRQNIQRVQTTRYFRPDIMISGREPGPTPTGVSPIDPASFMYTTQKEIWDSRKSPINPSWGADRSGAEMQSSKELTETMKTVSGDISKSVKEPRVMNITVNGYITDLDQLASEVAIRIDKYNYRVQ